MRISRVREVAAMVTSTTTSPTRLRRQGMTEAMDPDSKFHIGRAQVRRDQAILPQTNKSLAPRDLVNREIHQRANRNRQRAR